MFLDELPQGINNWTGYSTHSPPVKDSSDQHSHDNFQSTTSATI